MSGLAAGVEQGLVRPLDYQFYRFAKSYAPSDEITALTAFLLSKTQGESHVCLDLSHYAGRLLPLIPGAEPVAWPELAQWQERLLAHPCVTLPAKSESPMILSGSKLYLARYWHYETLVANAISQFVTRSSEPTPSTNALPAQLNQLFTEQDEGINWQKTTCALAQKQPFLVITGGPGTGKTTTVIRLLALTLMQNSAPENMQVRLVAPTGKAAVRMTESIRGAKQSLTVDDRIKALIPEQASTIHRLLGAIPNSNQFRHHKHNPLHLDLLVVDEASMIDLPLMAKLLAALPESCQLILLGDKDQLSSVEAGSVLGDLCSPIRQGQEGILMSYSEEQSQWLNQQLGQDFSAHEVEGAGLGNCLCMLQKSYRFGGGIGQLAQAVNQGQALRALNLLMDESLTDIELQSASTNRLIALAVQSYARFMAQLHQPAAEVLRELDQFRILCASHSGTFGTKAMNRAIQLGLKTRGLVEDENGLYPGLPLMILTNDYELKLFNGDIGVVLPIEQGSDELRVYFMESDGSVRSVLPGRLPAHEVAYAMTIHKSQGSEFAHVAMALDDEPAFRNLLVRELIYTGLTRAKQKLSLFTSPSTLERAVRQTTRRTSGLSERLLGR